MPPVQASPNNTRRGGRHGRGRGRGTRYQPQPQNNSQNQTHASTPSLQAESSELRRLDAEAPAFVPASLPPPTSATKSSQPQKPPKTPPNRQPPPRQKQRKASISRSTAPDIATRIHEDISKNIYECAICTNEVGRQSKVWACQTCWTVFHIGCIKRWSKNEGSAVRPTQGQVQDDADPKQWRCPGCNLPKDSYPSSYNCWCEKELDPNSIPGLPPHSCGQTCGRERKFPKSCPHPCDLICHAGPCPPCSAMGPKQYCYCGKEETSRRCVETDYDSGWSCGAICGDVMPCGDHTCQQPCHQGVCGACIVEIAAKCYCGKVEKSLPCFDQDEEKESYDWTGCFNCRQICNRAYDCGIHHCEWICHPQDKEDPHCPRSPDLVTHCPCGKTPLIELKSDERQSCTDPIPSCQKACGKVLACGHACTQICHAGDCLPCMLTVSISCRCGRNSFSTICHQGKEELPQCMRVCKANLNCGRHECGERCCSGERKAMERQATKRKLKPLGAVARAIDENIEAEHICTRMCGRPLKCGNHDCQDLCHKGPCSSCREAIFDDLACNCGRTVLQAPLPCGSQPPPCNFACRRPTTCGHPQVPHNCHLDDEECPKCPFLTEKNCSCGKVTLKNQPCWRTDALCGLVCGKTLKCGSHTCRKTCHKPGECEDAHQHCQQECGKAKKTCGHPCEQPCHAPSACKEEKLCPFKIIITCDCQRKKEEVRCNARAGVPEPHGRQTCLKCDDECARLERNRNLATALHISDDHTDDHVPYSTATLNTYLADVAWAHKQEEILRLFAADDEEKRYRFPPMKPHQRSFVHNMAEDFGFDSESVDPEPLRHIMLFKTPKFVSAPMKTLAQAARIKRAQLNISAPVQGTTERKEEEKVEFNGFLLTKPRFALTEDELRPIVMKSAPGIPFGISFLPGEVGVALIPSNCDTSVSILTALQPPLSSAITDANLAAAVHLCAFDTTGFEPRIIQIQSKSTSAATGGWSQVAAKRAVPRQAPQVAPVGQRPIYTVLGSRLQEARKKKLEDEAMLKKLAKARAEEPVVDDWEMEAEKEDAGVGGEASPVEVGVNEKQKDAVAPSSE